MIALVRFRVSGYVRSQRALYPLIVVALLVFLMLIQSPGAEHGARLTVGTLGDLAAIMVPIWAWTARALLDTEPDVQRDLSALAAGRPWTSVVAGLLAAYGTNAALAGMTLAVPVVHGLTFNVGAPALLAGAALQLLVAVPATLLGGWTARALIPSPAISTLILLGGCLMLLLLSMGPLAWLSIPMIEWLRAARTGPAAFTSAFPGVALHIAGWSAVVGAAYIGIRGRTRPC
jgi:hypothetical protein